MSNSVRRQNTTQGYVREEVVTVRHLCEITVYTERDCGGQQRCCLCLYDGAVYLCVLGYGFDE